MYIYGSQYLAEFFLDSEMLQVRIVEKIKTGLLCAITFIFENYAVYEIT
jgi:hypothetical protein